MKFNNTEIPDWLATDLRNMHPEPTFNHIIELLLQDYIKRNSPKPPYINPNGCEHEHHWQVGCPNCEEDLKVRGLKE